MRFEVDAILFDIDGTLVDSTAAVERSWRTWAARRQLDIDAILASCHGRRSEDTIAELLPESEHGTAIAELYQLELTDLVGVVALPGAAELLTALPDDRWAAVTSGARHLMETRLGAAGLPVPAVLVSSADVTVGKPDPQGYLLAAQRLGRQATACLVVEDAPAGIAAGLASGAVVVGVTTSHDSAQLQPAQAVITDLTHLTVAQGTDGKLAVTVTELPIA